MRESVRLRLSFGAAALVLLAAEIVIGLWVHDAFVRPYLGDTLVVVLLWAVARIVCPRGLPWLSAAVMVFATAVEVTQLWPLCDVLGVTSPLLRTLMGSSFAWGDMLAYAAGCLLTAGHDLVGCRRG